MIISTKKGTPKEELEKIVDKFEHQGLDVTLITGKDYNVFGLVGDTTKIDEREPFRKIDVVSFGCQGHFIGQGPQGYLHACAYLAQLLRLDGTPQAHIVM